MAGKPPPGGEGVNACLGVVNEEVVVSNKDEDCEKNLGLDTPPLHTGTTSGSTESDVTMGPQDSNLFGPCMVVDTRRRCPTLASKNGTGDGSRSGPSGSKFATIVVANGEDFEATNGLTPVNIQDSDMVSWMEHFLENEDRTSDIHEVHVPTYVARHEAGQEGRQ
ncbi:hypothetical protein V6N13_088634 [Hibiscus sabdariffa]